MWQSTFNTSLQISFTLQSTLSAPEMKCLAIILAQHLPRKWCGVSPSFPQAVHSGSIRISITVKCLLNVIASGQSNHRSRLLRPKAKQVSCLIGLHIETFLPVCIQKWTVMFSIFYWYFRTHLFNQAYDILCVSYLLTYFRTNCHLNPLPIDGSEPRSVAMTTEGVKLMERWKRRT